MGFDIPWNGQIRTSCPIHKGDNPTSLCVYPDKQSWVCWSHQCHKKFGSDLVGLVSGVKNISRNDALKFLEEDSEDVSDEEWALYDFVQKNQTKEHKSIKPIALDKYLKEKTIGSSYFEQEEFSKETIEKFGAFYCTKKGSPVYLRHCLPVLNITGELVIGVTGRSPHPECQLCGHHHSNKQDCICVPKWLHYGFPTKENLFNIHKVSNRVAIMTEGPKEPMRLYEYGIEPVVSSLSKILHVGQAKQLVAKGVDKLILLYDNDKEGLSGAQEIMNKYKNIFDIENWSPKLNKETDPAELINKEIIIDLWQNYISKTKQAN